MAVNVLIFQRSERLPVPGHALSTMELLVTQHSCITYEIHYILFNSFVGMLGGGGVFRARKIKCRRQRVYFSIWKFVNIIAKLLLSDLLGEDKASLF